MPSLLMSLMPSAFRSILSVGEAVAGALRGVGVQLSGLGQNIALDPGPGHIRVIGHFVLQFAGLDAQAAAHAFVGVNQEGPAHGGLVRRHLGEQLLGINDLQR